MNFDLLITNAALADGQNGVHLGVSEGKFIAVGSDTAIAQCPAKQTIDANNLLVSTPFVDAHFHMDATLSYGLPRINQSGTLLEGIALWGELKPQLTQQAIIDRALTYCDWAVGKGLLAIRSHVDVCDDRLLAVEALLQVRETVKPYLDLQLVAFPQDGVLRSANGLKNIERAMKMGVDVIGGIPHFERTMAEGARSVELLCEMAAKLSVPVDMHCDESDDPLSRHIETLTFQTQRLGLQGRVTGSHLTSMHSMDNYYVSKLLPLMAQAQMQVIANPLINITLQGRHDTYPKRRGMTRVPEMMAHGINVAFGHDCVMDPWYSFGSADMLEVAQMGVHVAQMTSQEQVRSAFAAVTKNPAKILGLQNYGLAVGCNADCVLLDARSPIEAIRLRANRLKVIRRGKVIAQSAAQTSQLNIQGRAETINWRT
jgi:cytosine/creatinine deaminase